MNGILEIGTALGLVLTAVFLIAGTAVSFLPDHPLRPGHGKARR
ncbi:hypothetical protein ACFQS3_13540 [Glycomyces mayteni]|uniref:Uncharacterized protein n=1 Tax=Glycomyces mayteni TaxID=543887 RepID=A0ABW2D796_9ACTN|nr:hypothetical protein GCM10025732_12040 [Glycomyces mayteni]